MNDLGKLLVIVGIVLVIAASAVESRRRLTSFPIATCLLVSVVPGLPAWLLRR